MGQRWYILGKRGEHGPVDARTLRRYAEERRIAPSTKVRREEDQDFRRAGSIRGLFPDEEEASESIHNRPTSAHSKQSKGHSEAEPKLSVDPKKTRKLFFVVDADQQEHGPYTISQLKELAQTKRLHPGSRLRNIDLAITNSARRVRGLFSDDEIAAYERQEQQRKLAAPAPSQPAQPVARPVSPQSAVDQRATERAAAPVPDSLAESAVSGMRATAPAPESRPAEQWAMVQATGAKAETYTRAQLAQLAARGMLKPEDRVRRLADGREVMAVRIPTVFSDEVVAAVRQRAQDEAAAKRAREAAAAAEQRQAEHDQQVAEARARAQRLQEAARAQAEVEAAAAGHTQEPMRRRAAAQLAASEVEPEPLRPEPATEVPCANDHPSDDGFDQDEGAEDIDFARVALSLAAPDVGLSSNGESADAHRGTDQHDSAAVRTPHPPRHPGRQSLPKAGQKPLSQSLDLGVLERRWHEWDAQRHRTESADLHRLVRGRRLPGSPNWEVDDPGAGLGIVPRCRRRVVHALALPGQRGANGERGRGTEMSKGIGESDFDREEDV